jgi:hypothetical protein
MKYLNINKYTENPVSAFQNIDPSRIVGILNTIQDSCIMIIERSTCSTVDVISGDTGREMLIKCIEKNWNVKQIIPGTSFSMYSGDTAPGTPMEIKFYFYNTTIPYYFYNDISSIPKGESEKLLEQTIIELNNAFKFVYTFDDVTITADLLQNILEKKPSFFKIKLIDKKTYMSGVIYLDNTMIEKIRKEEETS